jgi:hypothetical protein
MVDQRHASAALPRERDMARVEDPSGWVRKTCVVQIRKYVHWTVRVANMIYAHGSQIFSLLQFPRL